jgi:2-phospho-L-lactate guanylyltransferase
MRVLTVPVKHLSRAKNRLSSLLGPDERATLTLAMLEDVLDACQGQADWETWVISRSEPALEIAGRRGIRSVEEHGRSLGDAVRQVETELNRDDDELGVLLADLPFLSTEALRDALAAPSAVVASPAASDGGTNLLVRRPAGVIRARFGRSSFAKHRWAARRAGVAFEPFVRAELGFDLDRPDDLVRVLASEHPGRTRAVCIRLGLPDRLRLHA